MYICLCNGITDKDIKEAHKSRKGNIKEALKMLGVGNNCGSCVEFALQQLSTETLEHEHDSLKVTPDCKVRQ